MNLKLKILDRPNKAIVYPFAFLFLSRIWLFKLQKKKIINEDKQKNFTYLQSLYLIIEFSGHGILASVFRLLNSRF